MEYVMFEGSRYISSKRASEIAGYTQDYIGQLCRGKKLDCRLVGRSWYVQEGSLYRHCALSEEHQRQEKDTSTIVSSPTREESIELTSIPMEKSSVHSPSTPLMSAVSEQRDQNSRINIDKDRKSREREKVVKTSHSIPIRIKNEKSVNLGKPRGMDMVFQTKINPRSQDYRAVQRPAITTSSDIHEENFDFDRSNKAQNAPKYQLTSVFLGFLIVGVALLAQYVVQSMDVYTSDQGSVAQTSTLKLADWAF